MYVYLYRNNYETSSKSWKRFDSGVTDRKFNAVDNNRTMEEDLLTWRVLERIRCNKVSDGLT